MIINIPEDDDVPELNKILLTKRAMDSSEASINENTVEVHGSNFDKCVKTAKSFMRELTVIK